jgi:hypothetical protein
MKFIFVYGLWFMGLWFTESETDQQLEVELLTDDTNPEWAQLREMEEFLRLQRIELLQQGALDLDSEDWESPWWPTDREGITDIDEDDSLEDADLAFITSILESFSKNRSKAAEPSKLFCTTFPPEGVLMQSDAELVTPPKFNHNSMIKTSTTEKFKCFPTIEEEGADKFTVNNETKSEIDTEETEFEDHLQDICSITEEKKTFLQHGDLSFHKNLSSKTRLLSLGGRFLHSRSCHHWSLPSQLSWR